MVEDKINSDFRYSLFVNVVLFPFQYLLKKKYVIRKEKHGEYSEKQKLSEKYAFYQIKCV